MSILLEFVVAPIGCAEVSSAAAVTSRTVPDPSFTLRT
jgi:hypothetical protein